MATVLVLLQDLEEQKRTKYKINGTVTTAIENCTVLIVTLGKSETYKETMKEKLYCTRTRTYCTVFALELVLPASSFLIPDKSGIYPQ